MEEKFYINWADFVVGSEEIDWLLTEWRKDPKQKKLIELARILMNRQYELRTGFLPYDSRKPYKIKDKIKVKVLTAEGYHVHTPAEVINYVKNAHVDPEGYTWDEMHVRLLSQEAKLDGKENSVFVANCQGKFHAFSDFEIIPEKDVKGVVPKLLLALNNKQFANFGDYWLPSDLLISNLLEKIDDVKKIISENKQPLSTFEILSEIYTDDNRKELDERLEFSLNYFLEHDRRFIRITGEVCKWDIRIEIPHKTYGTVTIKPEWIEKGILIVPKKLSNCIKKTDILHVLYDQVDELLPYNPNERLIKGFDKFYSTKAIAEWDKVHLWIQGIEPTKLFLNCRWQRRYDRLLKKEPTDSSWEHISLRDCIIVVLSKFKTPAHYREIYSKIADHKDISPSTIIATLSKYSPSVFTHVCRGKWTLVGGVKQIEYHEKEQAKEEDKVEISKEVWEIVCKIEENDYVYKLLQKVGTPLSFDEICRRLAEYLGVDVNQLRATGFLRPDKRFRRFDNGEWVLEEWFILQETGPVPKESSTSMSEKMSWAKKLLSFFKSFVLSVNRYYSRFLNLVFRE